MMNRLRPEALLGLAGVTLMMAACGATIDRRRQDALWREYRGAGPAAATSTDAEPLAGADVLERSALVEAVLARNPDLAAAREGLRVALAAVPQATALPDPMVSGELAPLSIAGDTRFGFRVQVRQKLPFPGKRRLAGDVALAAAAAAATEDDQVRLALAQAASDLLDDLDVITRALAINAHHEALLAELKESATAQYVVGRAAQQDPIHAEVELVALARERLALESERDVTVARLNGLLHRAPAAELPPPPAALEMAPAPTGTSEELQSIAVERHPRRTAARARVDVADARIAMARRDFYPDVELMGMYDGMRDMVEHRWMVGVMVEVPLQRGRRRAAVEEATAMATRSRLEDEGLRDELRVEVDRAHRRVVEARALVALAEQDLLPAATRRLDAARAGFVAARNDFGTVIAADQALRDAELSLATARAELSRRNAALTRAVGLVPGVPEGGVR